MTGFFFDCALRWWSQLAGRGLAPSHPPPNGDEALSHV